MWPSISLSCLSPQTKCGNCGNDWHRVRLPIFRFLRLDSVRECLQVGPKELLGVNEMALGFAGLLCGPGVGILIACPLLLTILSCKLDEKARWILGLAASYLVLYSCWQRWWSSDWGPRFLMPILPALIALSVFTKHRRLWLALACFSFALQIPTAFAAPERQFSILRSEGIPPQVAVWSFSRSSTFGMWPSAMAQVQAAQSTDVRAFSQFRQSASSFDDAAISESSRSGGGCCRWYIFPESSERLFR